MAISTTDYPTKHDNKLADFLLGSSLNITLRQNPRLFALPQHWTQAHMAMLRVVWQHHDADRHHTEPVISVHLPDIQSDHLRQYIHRLKSPSTIPSYIRSVAMHNLFVSDDSSSHSEDSLAKLKDPIAIHYGGRSWGFLPNVNVYSLSTLEDEWRLTYLDISHVNDARRRYPARRTSVSDKSKKDDKIHDPCCIPGLFIAIAQQYQHSKTQTRASKHLRVRLLFTNNQLNSCINLYTACVPSFLLEHFRTPERPPDPEEPWPKQLPFLTIQRTRITYKPVKTFQHRLSDAIFSYSDNVITKENRQTDKRKRRHNAGDKLNKKRQKVVRQPLGAKSPNPARQSNKVLHI